MIRPSHHFCEQSTLNRRWEKLQQCANICLIFNVANKRQPRLFVEFFSLFVLWMNRGRRHRPAVNTFYRSHRVTLIAGVITKKPHPLDKLSKHIIQVSLPVNDSLLSENTQNFSPAVASCFPGLGVSILTLLMAHRWNPPGTWLETAVCNCSHPGSTWPWRKHDANVVLGVSGHLAQLRACQPEAELQVMLQ